MICPNCGTEASGSVCPVCGAVLETTDAGTNNGGFSLSGGMNVGAEQNMTDNVQPTDDFSDLENQPYSMGASDYQYSGPASTPKKSGAGAIIGVIVAVVAVAAVLLYFFVFRENGAKKSEELVKIYIEAIEAADTDAIVSVVDPECVSDDEITQLTAAFSMLTSMGVEYSLDYTITKTEKASKGTIKNMCGTLYGDTGVASKISSAYICSVDATMNMSYLGESQSEDQDMELICYKKSGKWYIGGYME